ncbi:DUF3159 domain-containing protein [soil metagenome]
MNDVDPAAPGPADDPSLTDNLAAAARRSGIGKVVPGETPTASALLQAMGGARGLVESILPGFAFVVVYTITGLLLPSVLIPVAIAVVFVLARVMAKQPYTSALAGVLGIALSAGVALLTGRAQDNFVLGFLVNAAFVVALLVSLAVRWPLIGIIASLITSEGSGWRSDRAKFRVAVIGTLIWVGLFGVRLAVELPLYFSGATQALGALKLILGVPLYAATLWVTWLLVRTVYARPEQD